MSSQALDLYRRVAGRIEAAIPVVSGRNVMALWLVIEVGAIRLTNPSPEPELQKLLKRNNKILVFAGEIPAKVTLSFRDLWDWEDAALEKRIFDAVQKILTEVSEPQS